MYCFSQLHDFDMVFGDSIPVLCFFRVYVTLKVSLADVCMAINLKKICYSPLNSCAQKVETGVIVVH
jgi:hypothetical protein